MKFFLLLYFPFALALTDPNTFSSSIIDLEEIVENSKSEKSYLSKQHVITPTALAALTDKKKIIDPNFEIPPFFKDNVYFWFSIYTQYSSKQVVIHDKDDLSIIYRVLDFSDLHTSDLNIFTKYKIQNQLAQENINQIKKALKKLGLGQSSGETKEIIDIFKTLNVKIPKSLKSKRAFFKKLSTNLRTQTGQKNMIYRGILNSEIYADYLYSKMDLFKIPNELVSVAFLESSFNYKAESRVGASGIWQFMPFIANLFMPVITKSIDYRSNPVISSLAAFHLLKQNYKILKRWDLAVPAYNSGTKHLVRARRKFKKVKNLDLVYILQNYNHPHLGFASQNFYSEFLALVHALKYKETFFNLDGKLNSPKFKSSNLDVYVTRCKFRVSYLDKKYNKNISLLNPQLLSSRKVYSSGTMIVSDKKLPNRYFYEVPNKTILERYPKNWHKGVTIKKCKLL